MLRICQTVDAARRWPSPASAPWMWRSPRVGFSAARRSVSRRSSAAVGGQPGGRCGWVQCRTMRRRCQRNSVSGVTNHPARLGRASAAAIAASKLRSASVISGRSTWRRSTASWWRDTMISRSFQRPDRPVSRAHTRQLTPRLNPKAHHSTGRPRSWALTRGFALHPGTRNRYKIRDTRTQHRPASQQVNDHGRVSGTHRHRSPGLTTGSPSAPACDGVVDAQTARVGSARADRLEVVPGRVGLPVLVGSPAGDGVVGAQAAREFMTGGDSTEVGLT